MKHGNPLSSQLEKITGDGWNAIDYISHEKGDVIKHKATGKCFIVMSESQFKALSEKAYSTLMASYRKTYNLSAIRTK